MPHIHTEPGQHDTTASAAIVRLDGATPRILLHMHKKHNMLLQPGGHVELHENPWQAILHEITEETGYEPSQLRVLQPPVRMKQLPGVFLHPVSVLTNTHEIGGSDPQHFHTDTLFAFTTVDEPHNLPGEGESQDLRWYTKEELIDLPDTMIYPDTKEMCLFVLTTCLSEWEEVASSEFNS